MRQRLHVRIKDRSGHTIGHSVLELMPGQTDGTVEKPYSWLVDASSDSGGPFTIDCVAEAMLETIGDDQ